MESLASATQYKLKNENEIKKLSARFFPHSVSIFNSNLKVYHKSLHTLLLLLAELFRFLFFRF